MPPRCRRRGHPNPFQAHTGTATECGQGQAHVCPACAQVRPPVSSCTKRQVCERDFHQRSPGKTRAHVLRIPALLDTVFDNVESQSGFVKDDPYSQNCG